MDRYLTAAAYYIIASRYHSGQSSKGYRKLSQADRMGLRLADSAWRRGSEERAAAAALLFARRHEIVRSW